MPPADAHEFAVENVASQRKFGAGNALISVSIDISLENHLDKRQTVSVFPVEGNMSTQQIFSTLYPLSCSGTRSLARLVGLQEM
jgi:hypothetical protein